MAPTSSRVACEPRRRCLRRSSGRTYVAKRESMLARKYGHVMVHLLLMSSDMQLCICSADLGRGDCSS